MHYLKFAALALVMVAFSATAYAQNSANQQVTITVGSFDLISVGGAVSIPINTATAGDAPAVGTGSSSYSVSTNNTDRRITAAVDSNLPAGLELRVGMEAPDGATAESAVILGTTAQNVVTGISTLNEAGLAINYEAEAAITFAPQVVSRVVTFTITAN